MKRPLVSMGATLLALICCSAIGAASAVATAPKLCQLNATPCTSGIPVGTEMKMGLAAGTVLQKRIGETLIGECSGSSISAKLTAAGSETTPAVAGLSSFTFSACTCTFSVISPGSFSIESIPGTMNGQVRWSGFEFVEVCGSEGECRFGSEVTKGIRLKGGSEGQLRFEEALIPKKSGTGTFCTNKKWTGTYSISTPKPIYVAGPTSESFPGAGVLCSVGLSSCSGFAKPYPSGTTLTAKLKTGVPLTLEMGFANVKCEGSSMNGEIQDPGSSTEPAVAVLSSWTFSGCNCEVKAPKSGAIGVDWTSGNNGALTILGLEIAINCGGKECTLGSSVKEGIALTGGNPATIKATAAPIPKKSGIAECNSTAKWNAEYEVTAPKPLDVTET
jgi:hypothetical protein